MRYPLQLHCCGDLAASASRPRRAQPPRALPLPLPLPLPRSCGFQEVPASQVPLLLRLEYLAGLVVAWLVTRERLVLMQLAAGQRQQAAGGGGGRGGG